MTATNSNDGPSKDASTSGNILKRLKWIKKNIPARNGDIGLTRDELSQTIAALEAPTQEIVGELREKVTAQYDEWMETAKKAAKKDGDDIWLTVELASYEFEKRRILAILSQSAASKEESKS